MNMFMSLVTWSNGDKQVIFHLQEILILESAKPFRWANGDELESICINLNHIRCVEPRGQHTLVKGEWQKIEE